MIERKVNIIKQNPKFVKQTLKNLKLSFSNLDISNDSKNYLRIGNFYVFANNLNKNF